jgi:flagellar L-ring protein precursor FlgH
MRKFTPATAALALALAAAPLAAQAPGAGAAAPAATGAAAAAPAAATPAATGAIPAPAPARPARQSWTADRREFAVGDVITILIDEQTLASANHDNSAVDRRSRNADLSLGAGGAVGALSGLGASVDSRHDAQSRQSGDALRANRFSGEMSLRVTSVEPGGRLQVAGTKVINVDRSEEKIELKGWVRAQDVSAGNLVDSWRIADAQIVYTSAGSISKPKGSIIGRLLGALWP